MSGSAARNLTYMDWKAVVGAHTVGECLSPAAVSRTRVFAHSVGSYGEAVVGAHTVGECLSPAGVHRTRAFADNVGAHRGRLL